MDIRKFFGANTAGPKQAESKKDSSKNSKPEKGPEKLVNNKGGKSKNDSKNSKSEQGTAKLAKNKGGKSLISKEKSKCQNDDNIVIDDSSDEDIVKSSQTSSASKAPNKDQNKARSRSKENVQKKEEIKAKSSSNLRSDEKEEKDKSKNRSDPSKKKSNAGGKVREKVAADGHSNSSKNKNDKSQSQNTNTEKRSSPGKAKPDSNANSISKGKLHKENSTSSNDIVVESSDEESPVVRKKGKGRTSTLKRKSRLFDSDSEEDPLPQGKPPVKKKKNGHSIVVDSDEEQKETALDKFIVHKSTPASTSEKKKEEKKSTPVNLSDFFGSGSASASRKDRPAASVKRKLEEDIAVQKKEPVADVVFDEEMHDDEDFLKTLDQLDGPDIKKAKLQESPKKEKGGTLASKLANKVKSSKDEPQDGRGIKSLKKTSPSPAKKVTTPPKETTKTSLKKGKTYTMEVTKTKIEKKFPSSPKETKEEVTPIKPQKAARTQKSSEKKEVENGEDDGFGLKTSSSFRAFKMRGGPLALGSKEIPEGEENCLEGMTFVITGILDSIERDDAKSLVEKLGGKVTTSISKKTSHVVVGREPGESKLKKANELKISQIDEDGLFDLIRTLPGKTSKYEVKAQEELKREESLKAEKKASASKKLESFRLEKTKGKDDFEGQFTQLKSSEMAKKGDNSSSSKLRIESDHQGVPSEAETLLWVDKHKPTSLKQIIGQHGDKSNANKLLHWMRKWHENIIVKGLKASGNFFGGKGDGTGFRAALLSGPPGIGKTTTATLVCKEVGFSYVELNASDTRSKRSLKEVVAESLNNETLVDYMGDSKKKDHGHKHCLIMDEVDGMAGNEDRGGIQELVQLIKTSKIPIICICNDRNSMKMRTLANYCFDLRFSRPRVEQIKGAMMTLAFREGLKIPPAAVQEIIMASNHDIRQIIHNLSMWSAGDKQLTYEQVKFDAKKAQKDIKLGPFDVCRKVFVIDEETSKMSLSDKSNLFFHDYSFGPLFVHENYPHIIPVAARDDNKRHMACLARTIDSLCDGDMVEKRIRKEGNWNLLPTQAMYSSVIPGEYMRGKFPQMTEFPSWLGKNSSTGKTDRILQELNRHMHLQVSCDKRGLNLDYLPALRVRLTSPLLEQGSEGVADVIAMMDDYDIVKEDFDNIMEVTKWPGSADPLAKLESKTKAAFTRQYNKGSHMTPYSTGAAGKKRKGRATAVDEGSLLVEPGDEAPVLEESEEDEDEPVVVAKPKASASKGKQAASRGKGSKGKK